MNTQGLAGPLGPNSHQAYLELRREAGSKQGLPSLPLRTTVNKVGLYRGQEEKTLHFGIGSEGQERESSQEIQDELLPRFFNSSLKASPKMTG